MRGARLAGTILTYRPKSREDAGKYGQYNERASPEATHDIFDCPGVEAKRDQHEH